MNFLVQLAMIVIFMQLKTKQRSDTSTEDDLRLATVDDGPRS
jgi:hypothetical protein